MSENTEFIPAKDLPEATGDTVSVVCLENGELKQKSGASLGGASYDMKVRIWFEYDGEEVNTHCKVLEGDYATVCEKINNDCPAVALAIEDANGEGMPDDWIPYKYVGTSALVWHKSPKTSKEALIGMGRAHEFYVLPDNTAGSL